MVRPIQLFGAAATIVCRLNSPAFAQPGQPAPRPPVEVGVGMDTAYMRAGLYLDEGMVLEPMVNVRLTKPSTANLAFEMTFAVGGTPSSDYHTKGLYTLQVKHRLWRPSRAIFRCLRRMAPPAFGGRIAFTPAVEPRGPATQCSLSMPWLAQAFNGKLRRVPPCVARYKQWVWHGRPSACESRLAFRYRSLVFAPKPSD
jgi:hypothetical protein